MRTWFADIVRGAHANDASRLSVSANAVSSGSQVSSTRESPSAAAEPHHISGCQFCLLLAVSQ